MKGTKGDWPGAEPFVKAMAALKIDAVRGPVAFDDMRGYDKDELWNTVIKTYPNVGQFWTYDKATFLKQPVYSRDFPPCKFCQ
jgi:branched-chain amino acid transport system substrate-binding protein